MPGDGVLPNFLGIGASKSGTTTLYDLLVEHPEVYLSPTKELKYFNVERNYAKGRGWYESNFRGHGAEQAIGEITPGYLYHPQAAGRIRELLGGEVRLVATLRNPADRAISHYVSNVRSGIERLDFADAIEREGDRIEESEKAARRYSYISRGLYAEQLERYLEHFQRDQLHLIVFERGILSNQREMLGDLCRFLAIEDRGLDAEIHSIKGGRRGTKSGSAGLTLRQRIANRLGGAGPSEAQFGPEYRSELINRFFAPSIERLETLTGLDCSVWRS